MWTRKGLPVYFPQRTYCAWCGCSSNCYKTNAEIGRSGKFKCEWCIAGIIDVDVDDVYNVVLIERLLHILQRDKIRKAVLEKYSSTVCCNGYYWIVDTLKNHRLICNYFKSFKQDWEIIKNKKGFLFSHKIKR